MCEALLIVGCGLGALLLLGVMLLLAQLKKIAADFNALAAKVDAAGPMSGTEASEIP